MRIWTVMLLLFVANTSLHAQDDADLAKALALQKVMQKSIQQTEPAIACILVSRSKGYEEVGQGPDRRQPGKLGALNVTALRDALTNHPKLSLDDPQHYLKQLDFTDPAYVPRAFGSGVVIDASGLILTNYHVVQDATKLFVRLPGGKQSYADIHAADPRSDLAVLKLLSPTVAPLKTIAFGDADKLERGQFVLTLSNPFAVGFRDGQPSASWGILSNIRRRVVPVTTEVENIKPFHFYSTLLQTDARVNLGCSGGALLNLQGEMVGLITSTAAIQGGETPGGFAVPLTANVRRIIDVLKRGEEVDYGFLGINPDRTPRNGRPGVMLDTVGKGSPADVDGKLDKRDILLSINGQALREVEDIFIQIATHLAGTKVRLIVQRGNVQFPVDVTLAKLNVPTKAIASSTGSRPYVRGLRVDYASLVAAAIQPRGVLVCDVQPKSSAERAGLITGAAITHVNQRAVTTPAEFYQAMPAFGPVELTLYSLPGEPVVRIQLK
jgi:serine protease Do